MDVSAAILIFIIVILAIWQVFPFFYSRKMRGQPSPDISPLLHASQNKNGRYLLYFWHPHCRMCKNMSKTIEELSRTNSNIIRVNTEQHLNLATKFRIIGTPSTIIVDRGEIERILVGIKSKAQLIKILDRST